MGRLRKTARSIFSFGGYDGVSPIAKEDEKTLLLKKQNALIEEQTRALRNAAKPTPMPGQKRYCKYCRRKRCRPLTGLYLTCMSRTGASHAHARKPGGCCSSSVQPRRDCCQYCCHGDGQQPPGVDSRGMSAQRTDRIGRPWAMRPLLRIGRGSPSACSSRWTVRYLRPIVTLRTWPPCNYSLGARPC